MSDPFAQGIRSKFSGYDDISDDEVLSRFITAAKTNPAKFSSAMRSAFQGYDDTPDAEVAQRFLSKYAPAPAPAAPQSQAPEQPQTVFDAMRQTDAGQMPVAQPAPALAQQRGFSGGLPDEAYSVARGASATASGATLPQSFVDASNKRLEAERPRPAGLYAGEEQGMVGKAWDFIKDLSGAGPAAQTAKAQIQLEAQKASEAAMREAYTRARAEGLTDEKAQLEARKAYLTPSQYANKIYPAGEGMRELQSLIPSAARSMIGSAADLSSITGVVLGSKVMKNLAADLSIASDEIEPLSNTFLTKLAGAGGSMAFFWLPGIGIARGAERLAMLSARASEYLGIAANTALEAGTEAGGVYNQVLNETGDTKKASMAAAKTFALNAMVIPVTDKLGGLFSRTKGARATAIASGTEFVQEGTQSAISDVAQGKPIDWKATGESAVIGGVAGGTFKAVGERALGTLASDPVMKDYFYQKSAKAEAIRKEAEAAQQRQAEVEQGIEQGKEEKRAETAAYAEDEARKRAAEAAGLEVGPEGQMAEKGTGPKELPVEAVKEPESAVEAKRTMEAKAQPAPVVEGKAEKSNIDTKQLAAKYASEMGQTPSEHHTKFAEAIANKDVQYLDKILVASDKWNRISQRVFKETTGIEWPSTIPEKRKALYAWAGKEMPVQPLKPPPPQKITRAEATTKMQAAKDAKILDTQVMYRGEKNIQETRREHIDRVLSEGGRAELEQRIDTKAIEKANKELRQIRFNGEQNVKAERVKELQDIIANPPMQKKYRIVNKSGSFYYGTKAEYDYAISKQAKPQEATNGLQKQGKDEGQETEIRPTLPKELSRSSPNYKLSKTKFESDTDRALYIVGGKLKSKSHDKFMGWLSAQGFTPDQIARGSERVRAKVKELGTGEPEIIEIPDQKISPEKTGGTGIRGSFLGAGEAAEAIANTASKITAAVSERITGNKLPENLTVMTPKGPQLRDDKATTSALWHMRGFISNRWVSKVAEGFRKYYYAGERAVSEQAKWADIGDRDAKFIMRPIERAGNRERDKEDFKKAVFLADMTEHTYTFDELKELEISAPAASAYIRRAKVMHRYWKSIVEFKASFLPEGELRDNFIKEMKAKEIQGYVNHEFNKWAVREITKNEQGEIKKTLVGSFDTVRECSKAMKSDGKGIIGYSSDKQYVIEPFQMKIGQDTKTGTTDVKYFTTINKMMKQFNLTDKEAKELAAIKPYNRHRFLKNMMKRQRVTLENGKTAWVGGYKMEDPMELFSIYTARWGRYVAMENFKTNVVGKFQRQYGHDYRTADNINSNDPRHDEAVFTANYIKNILGERNDPFENWGNSVIESATKGLNKVTMGLVDVQTKEERPMLTAVHYFNKAMSVLKLSGFSAGAVNALQAINVIAMTDMKWCMHGYAAAMNMTVKEASGFVAGRLTGGTGVAFNEKMYRETRAMLRRAGIAGMSQNVSFAQEASYDVRKASGVLNNAAFVLMFPFRAGERLNRVVALSAFYAQARDAGASEQAATDYAIEMNDKVNFNYTVANSPAMFSSAIGRLLFQFKSYTAFQTELLASDMTNRQRARFAIAVLMVGGAASEPLWEDAARLASFILSKTKGRPIDFEAEVFSFFNEWAGKDKAKQFAVKQFLGGIFASVLGIDATRRISLSLVPSADGPSWGPAAGTLIGTKKEAEKIAPEKGKRILKMLSAPLANLFAGIDMYKKGFYIAKGGGTMDVTKNQALFKAEGFRLWKEKVNEIENTLDRLSEQKGREESLDVNWVVAKNIAKYVSEPDEKKAAEIMENTASALEKGQERYSFDSVQGYLEQMGFSREINVLKKALSGVKTDEDMQEAFKQTNMRNLY